MHRVQSLTHDAAMNMPGSAVSACTLHTAYFSQLPAARNLALSCEGCRLARVQQVLACLHAPRKPTAP